MDDKGQTKVLAVRNKSKDLGDFVLDKPIFNNVFEKDVRRIYIYKKCDRIAKAVHLISPAFKDSKPLRERLQRLSVELIDSSSRPLPDAREDLSRELLTLMSILSMARASQMLSPMNADLIIQESQALLHDIASYEDPRVVLEDTPTLASISKSVTEVRKPVVERVAKAPKTQGQTKGQEVKIKDTSSRRESILSVLRSKGPSYIKDISTVIRDVSEKTIQRELQALVSEGVITKTGERRWTTYTIKGA